MLSDDLTRRVLPDLKVALLFDLQRPGMGPIPDGMLEGDLVGEALRQLLAEGKIREKQRVPGGAFYEVAAQLPPPAP